MPRPDPAPAWRPVGRVARDLLAHAAAVRGDKDSAGALAPEAKTKTGDA